MGLLHPSEATKATPRAERRIRYTTEVGRCDFLFPEGHEFVETADMVIATYGKVNLTIHKNDVKNLHIEAAYLEEE
jgi:hypothetical protein